MGKIRTKVIGDETAEKEQKKRAKKRQEAKIAKGYSLRKQGVSLSDSENKKPATTETEKLSASAVINKPSAKSKSKQKRSQKYQAAAKMIDKAKTYSLSDALTLLEKIKRSKFDETVELHINTTEAGLTGAMTLPHGTGKKTRVVIADPSAASGQVDALIKKIESGIIDFDILIATPSAMPKLARVAKILGPRGLMPNPKNGTITQNPDEVAKKYESGQIRFKTEAKTPIIHLSVGKISFGDKKLAENIKEVFKTVTQGKIKNATIKSTMSPGIKIAL